jgi:hypothetical protein
MLKHNTKEFQKDKNILMMHKKETYKVIKILVNNIYKKYKK